MTYRPRFNPRQQGVMRRIAVDRLVKETDGIVPTSKQSNRSYTYNDFIFGLVNAAHQNKSVGKVATTRRSGFMDIHGSPTDQWFNSAIGEAKSEDIDRILERNMAANLARIRRIAPEVDREWKKAGMVVGIDTHDQMRYDKKPKGMATDEEMKQWLDERGICRSRYLKGTDLRTTFATISCITGGSSFFLGVIHKKMDDEMSDLVRRLVGKCDDLEIRLGLVMLDRGFYTTDVIHSLKEIRAEKKKQDPGSPFDYLIQCRRTKRVKDALDEYAEMGVAASEGVITGKTSKSGGKPVPVSYCIHIVKSKAYEARERRNERKKGGRKKGRTNRCGRCGQKRPETPPGSDPNIHPGCKFTGFACGMLDTDASRYAERWMNESRYRVLEEQMPRTRNTAKAARYLCVAIAVILHNLVIIANMELLALSRNATGTRLPTHDTVVSQFIRALKSLLAKWRREPDPILDADAPASR